MVDDGYTKVSLFFSPWLCYVSTDSRVCVPTRYSIGMIIYIRIYVGTHTSTRLRRAYNIVKMYTYSIRGFSHRHKLLR